MIEVIGGYAVHPAAQVFPMMEGDEFNEFRDDLRDYGQHEPVILIKNEDGISQVLDGRNRLRALSELGIRPEFDWYSGENPIEYVLSRNLRRRHLNESQRAVVGARLKPLYEEDAKRRQLAGLKQNQTQEAPQPRQDQEAAPEEAAKAAVPADRPERSGESREQAARAVNVGARTVSRAEKALKNGVPELVELVERGRIRVELAERLAERPHDEQRRIIAKIKEALEKKPLRNPKDIVRRHDKDVVITRIRSEPMPLPEGPFRVIMADPAWMYEKRKDDGTQRGQITYPGMTIQEICALGEQVKRAAYNDCVLWMWITNAHLLDGVQVEILEAWGFRPKTLLTWRKPKMGTGDWLRGKTEHCIMAVRGTPTVDLTNQTTDFYVDDNGYYFEADPSSNEHSAKPDAFYEFVEKLCPGSKLEMFSRKSREGWQVWGAETGKLDEEPASD